MYVFKQEGEWWEGEVNGVYGRFPAKHVRLLKEKPNDGDALAQALYFARANNQPEQDKQ